MQFARAIFADLNMHEKLSARGKKAVGETDMLKGNEVSSNQSHYHKCN